MTAVCPVEISVFLQRAQDCAATHTEVPLLPAPPQAPYQKDSSETLQSSEGSLSAVLLSQLCNEILAPLTPQSVRSLSFPDHQQRSLHLRHNVLRLSLSAVSYTHLTLPTK